MFTVRAINQAKVVTTTAAQLGAKLPAPALAAYERATRITEAARRLHPGQDALVAAVTAALAAGREPATDPEVARVDLAARIGNEGVAAGVEGIVAGEMTAVWTAHADAIARALARPFDDAAAVVATSHARIGPHPLDDTGAILRQGGDIGEVWGKAKDAVATIAAIDTAWLSLANVTRFATIDKRYAALRYSVATAEQWETAGLEARRDVDAWVVALAGLELSLADGAEYRRRIAVVTAEPPPQPRPPKPTFPIYLGRDKAPEVAA